MNDFLANLPLKSIKEYIVFFALSLPKYNGFNKQQCSQDLTVLIYTYCASESKPPEASCFNLAEKKLKEKQNRFSQKRAQTLAFIGQILLFV